MTITNEQANTDRISIVAIAGYGRSGSTLMQSMLAEELDGCALGELKYLWRRGFIDNELCSCGCKTKECEFWTQLGTIVFKKFAMSAEEIEKTRLSVERNRHYFIHEILKLRSKTYTEKLKLYQDILEFTITTAASLSQSGTIIDSSKDIAHHNIIKKISNINKTFIHLVRDPRAVAYSQMTPKQKREVWWEERYMKARHPISSTFYWIYLNLLCERLRTSENYILVKYEDLVDEPKKILGLIAKNNQKKDNIIHHEIGGNPNRFSSDRGNLKVDRRWVSDLYKIHKYTITLITYPLLKRYGYTNKVSLRK